MQHQWCMLKACQRHSGGVLDILWPSMAHFEPASKCSINGACSMHVNGKHVVSWSCCDQMWLILSLLMVVASPEHVEGMSQALIRVPPEKQTLPQFPVRSGHRISTDTPSPESSSKSFNVSTDLPPSPNHYVSTLPDEEKHIFLKHAKTLRQADIRCADYLTRLQQQERQDLSEDFKVLKAKGHTPFLRGSEVKYYHADKMHTCKQSQAQKGLGFKV